MSTVRKLFTACTILAASAVLLAPCGCKKGPAAQEGPAERVRQKVEVATISQGSVRDIVSLTGEVMPLSTVMLTSKVAGRLEKLRAADSTPIAEGTLVKAGEPVAEIDKALYAAQLAQAEAAVAAATAASEDASREEARVAALFKDGAVTGQMRDKAATGKAAASAGLRQAEAARDMAKISFDEAIIESPISGVVTAKLIDEGNMIAPGVPILRIEDMSMARVVFSIPERHLSRLAPDKTPVFITSEDTGAEPLKTVVAKIHPSADRITRTTCVEALIDNTKGALRSGMFVKVAIEADRMDGVPLVPAAAILRQGNDAVVFVADGARAARRVVRLGLLENNMYAAAEGLAEGDRVIVRGQHLLGDGDPIEVVGGGAQ